MNEENDVFYNANNEAIEMSSGVRDVAYRKRSQKAEPVDAAIDIDKDGRISVREAHLAYKKKKIQRRITIVSFLVLLAMTAYIFVWASESRIDVLASAMDVCYIVFGGIVGAYFGVELLDKRR